MLTKNSSRCIIDTLSSTEKDILLSITIPTFKRFSLLKETLRSVFENQFSFPVEVIIVDNDPENEEQALEEMSEFSINEFRYYKNTQNYGMFGNWNQCLTLARGKYITILHDDDLLKKNFALVTSREITKGLHAFGFQWEVLDQRSSDTQPDKNFFHAIFKSTKAKLSSDFNEKDYGLLDFFMMNKFMGTLGVIFERDKAIEINGFDEQGYPTSDYDFWLRWIIKYGSIKFINEHVSLYRVRENESMRPEVIDLFVNKNDEIRRDIVETKKLNTPPFLLDLLRVRDQYLFNFNWASNERYKKTSINVIRYIFIRVLCNVLSRFITVNK